MKSLRFSLIIFFITIVNIALAQVNNYASNNLIKKLSQLPIPENIFLHFDKPYYAAGDTIYFKCYVTMGYWHKLTNISSVLHVDLINTANAIDKSIKLQIMDGVAWGDFVLADTLPQGRYRVRAYTQLMRNEGNYFDQILPIGSITSDNNKFAKNIDLTKDTPDLQFFPEGGDLIEGVTSKLAFKAIDVNGLGIEVNGIIKDNNGLQVANFASTHLGMGYLNFKPTEGKSYQAVVKYRNGVETNINLPLAKHSGISLSIDNDSIPKATVRISANGVFFNKNKNKNYYLLIFSGGTAITVNFKLDSTLMMFDILKRHLHTGVTRITLFSQDDEPLCERLIFVQNYDQLKFDISNNKKTYTTKEHVEIKINAVNRAGLAATGHFSVSVIDEGKVSVDEESEHTILSNLLLTSELTGYIEKPNYYFLNINSKTSADLDVVMMTNGYRRFEWKQILSGDFVPVKWQQENGLHIDGISKNLIGRPLKNGAVSLIPIKSNGFLSVKTDSTGHFSFNKLTFFDSTQFVLQAANARGENLTKIIYSKEVAEPLVNKLPIDNNDVNQFMPDYLKNKEKEQEELSSRGFGRGRMLKEVKIKDRKLRRLDDTYRTQSLAGAGFADQVMHSKEIENIQGPLATSLNGRLHNIMIYNFNGKVEATYLNRPMLIVVDGVENGDISTLNANEVETVEVLRSGNSSIYGMSGGNGVIIITTKQGGVDPEDIQSFGVLPIKVLGYYKPREFYSPKYTSTSTNKISDLRSTIFWKPDLTIDKNGLTDFDYFNAGSPGIYRVEIEGVDENGNLGQQVYHYKVL